MSLTIVKIAPLPLRLLITAVALAALVLAWFFIKWNFANAVAERIDTAQPEAGSVAAWLVALAPNDPQTHFASARVFEKTFNSGDLEKSLSEYERASALSPNHYVMWLNLGKARSLNGDAGGATVAYDRALKLAPNYAAVQWAYGNSLLRQGNIDEGFKMISKAAAANPDYARTTALTALEMFGGDLGQVRQVLGASDATSAALAAVLMKQSRFDEAVDAWASLPPPEKQNKYNQLGTSLAGQLAGAKKFRLAARVYTEVAGGQGPAVGALPNGDFESGVKLTNPGLFEWQIGQGPQPQVAQAEGGPRGGRFSLLMVFNSFATADFRNISMMTAVEPGAEYEIELFYKSDVKSTAALRWEVVDAATMAVIGATPALGPAGEWTSAKAKFSAAGSDGVIIRLGREGCNGASCPFTGKISFDEFSMRKL